MPQKTIPFQAIWTTKPAGAKNHSRVEVPAYPTETPGLVVHRTLLVPASFEAGKEVAPELGNTWTLAHEPSGWAVILSLRYKTTAFLLAKLLAEVADWTLEKDELIKTPDLYKKFSEMRDKALEQKHE